MVKKAQEWLDEVFPRKEERNKVTELKNIGQKWLAIVEGIKIPLPWKESLEGKLDLREFKNLKKLDCSDSQINSLNIRGLTNLETLNCSNNQLSELDLSDNINLKDFFCQKNSLTEIIGFEKLNKLETVNSSGNANFNAIKALGQSMDENISNVKELLNSYKRLMNDEINAHQRIKNSPDVFDESEREESDKNIQEYQEQVAKIEILTNKWK